MRNDEKIRSAQGNSFSLDIEMYEPGYDLGIFPLVKNYAAHSGKKLYLVSVLLYYST